VSGDAAARRARDRWTGDLQHTADRLDPICGAMIVYEWRHGLNRRSSSAWAKYAEPCAGISLAWRSSLFSRSSASSARARRSKDLPERPDPAAAWGPSWQGLRRTPDLGRDRDDRRPLRGMLAPVSITSRTARSRTSGETSSAPLLVHAHPLRVGASGKQTRAVQNMSLNIIGRMVFGVRVKRRAGAALRTRARRIRHKETMMTTQVVAVLGGTGLQGGGVVTRSWAAGKFAVRVCQPPIPPATLRGRWRCVSRGCQADLLDRSASAPRSRGARSLRPSPTSGIPHRAT